MALHESPGRYADELARIAEELQKASYPEWLLRNIGGWLADARGNAAGFSYAIRHLPQCAAILEIGTYLGQSACMMSYLMWKHNRLLPLFCCDPYDFENTDEPIGGFFDAGSSAFRDYCIETAKRNLQIFSAHCLPHLVETSSRDFLAAWARREEREDLFGRRVRLGGPLGLVYIDGVHTYLAVKNDFEGVDPFIAPGGFVLLDHSNPDWPDIHRLAQELRLRPDYEVIFNQPNYFFRKRSEIDLSTKSTIVW